MTTPATRHLANDVVVVGDEDDPFDGGTRGRKGSLCLRNDFIWSAGIPLLTAIGDHHRQVGQNHGAGDQHPAGPPGNEDRANHARRANTHRDQILAGPTGLFIAERSLGTRDRVMGLRHPNKVNPIQADRAPVRSRSQCPRPKESSMSDRVYGISEVVGTSADSIEGAIRNAVRRAGADHLHVDWFEVQQVRGYVRSNEVDHFQVTVKVGYRLEDA